MEQQLRFDGNLNTAQANLPAGDYSDANNIAITEDNQGNGGAVKKLRSITEFADLSAYGTVKASAIDVDGNQYFVCHKSNATLTYLELGGLDSNVINLSSVSQSNGFSGYILYLGTGVTDEAYVFTLAGTATDSLQLTTTEGDEDVNSVSTSTKNTVTILSVDTSGTISVVTAYVVTTTPSITYPDLKIIGDTLFWNFYGSGVPLSFLTTRTGQSFSDETIVGDENDISNLYLIKPQPVDIIVTPNAGSNDLFASNTFDFACRYVYDSGEVSALSNYRTVKAEADLSELNFGIDGYDDVDLEVNETFPAFASKVQWYGRVNGGTWRRIATATEGFVVTFNGQFSEALSTDDSTRSFDSVPVTSQAIEVIKNRVFLGNVVDDLDLSATESVTLTLTGNVFSDDFTSGGAQNIDDPFSYLDSGANETVADDVDGGTVKTDYVGQRNQLTNDSTYKVGLVFYDEFMRNRGVSPTSIKTFTTGNFAFPTRIKSIAVSVSNAPSWAQYAQIVATRNLSKDFSIEGYANSIFFRLEDEERNYYFSNFAPTGVTVESIVIDTDISYTYQDGDKINILLSNGNVGKLAIKSVSDGLIYCDPNPYFNGVNISGSDNYIEIYSPKAPSEDESTIFYETGEIVSVSSLPTTITNPDIYDQTLIKRNVNIPSFETCIDSDTPYHFQGDSAATKQDGFPIGISGGLIYLRNDYESTTVTSSTELVEFDGLHTNDPLDSMANCYVANDTGHGHSFGDVQVADGGTTTFERVVRYIDVNNYVAAIDALFVQTVSASGFSSGDAVTITLDDGSIISGYVGYTSSTSVFINSITLREATYHPSKYKSISDGTSSFNVVNAFYNYPGAFNAGVASGGTYGSLSSGDLANRTLFTTNNKVYVSSPVDETVSSEIFAYPLDVSNLAAQDPLVRFDNIKGLTIPSVSDKYKIYYSITATVDAADSNAAAITVGLYVDATLIDSISLANTGGTGTIDGVHELDYDGNGMSSIVLRLSHADAGAGTVTISKNSYIHAVSASEDNQGILDSSFTTKYALSRKPNKRREDDFTWDRSSGKPSLEDNGIAARTYETKIRYGGKYVEDAVINPVSSFEFDSQETVPQESGAITALVRASKMSEVGSVLLAVCERETNSIYVGERIVTNNDGSTSLLASDSVIGSVQPLLGNRGCQHKQSISKDQAGNVFWWDAINRDVVRYSREGIVVVSDYKMKPTFESQTGAAVTFYDNLYDTYFIHFPTSGDTVSFKQGFGWVSFHDFSVDLGGEQYNERSYPIYGNKIYKTIGSSFGSYFGTTRTADITLSLINTQNFEPIFLRLRGNLVNYTTYTVNGIDITITNDNSQSTTLDEGFFEIDGSNIFSDVYRDENSTGGISNGIPLLASRHNVKITLGSDTTTSQAVKEAYLGVRQMPY